MSSSYWIGEAEGLGEDVAVDFSFEDFARRVAQHLDGEFVVGSVRAQHVAVVLHGAVESDRDSFDTCHDVARFDPDVVGDRPGFDTRHPESCGGAVL